MYLFFLLFVSHARKEDEEDEEMAKRSAKKKKDFFLVDLPLSNQLKSSNDKILKNKIKRGVFVSIMQAYRRWLVLDKFTPSKLHRIVEYTVDKENGESEREREGESKCVCVASSSLGMSFIDSRILTLIFSLQSARNTKNIRNLSQEQGGQGGHGGKKRRMTLDHGHLGDKVSFLLVPLSNSVPELTLCALAWNGRDGY